MNGQDTRSRKNEFFVERAGEPVADNGARCEVKPRVDRDCSRLNPDFYPSGQHHHTIYSPAAAEYEVFDTTMLPQIVTILERVLIW